ncbi:uncharacterized protein LOC143051131 [Mytilus galloprovincialis]|uniref:uncharacterized protein LOC143051131 n=1 Tax=Mytilus galloprovincialis TaxID=29158 RepID=UPI003F7BFF1A
MTINSLIVLLLFANLLSQIDCGSVCYSCTGMAENDSCHNVATCQDDEVCFTQKYQTEDNKTRFDVGCSYPELCRKNSMGTIFGKRAAGLGHVLCHHCCTENVCNSAFTCTDNFKAPTLSCMYCSGIDMIGKCNSTITCTNDEVCFIQKYRTPMNQVKYDLGCKRSTASTFSFL